MAHSQTGTTDFFTRGPGDLPESTAIETAWYCKQRARDRGISQNCFADFLRCYRQIRPRCHCTFWLPDAMEGPTPVVRIHAATMWPRECFSWARFTRVWRCHPGTLRGSGALFVQVVTWVGRNHSGFLRRAIPSRKRHPNGILAYSTVSQLGYYETPDGPRFGGRGLAARWMFTSSSRVFPKRCYSSARGQ